MKNKNKCRINHFSSLQRFNPNYSLRIFGNDINFEGYSSIVLQLSKSKAFLSILNIVMVEHL